MIQAAANVQHGCLISSRRTKFNKVIEDEVRDRTYAALADPTRRALLVALRSGDARITDLAAPLSMTFAGVSRHIGVLESAGPVQRVIREREHWLSIRPEGLGADPSIETVVKVLLEPCGHQQTLMTIEHSLLPPGLADQHERRWMAIAGQFADELAAAAPGSSPARP